ncbi:MAG TPA: site-2 protease family protein [Trebonia sp.]|jgi:membrane-associated protease RseP (regulator of RpoE activity)|nr:site-2 protease family protein [Trebonia sp.]
MDWLGWLIFLFALMFSVMLHESGHFVAAKQFGMKVTRYFVGFGPTIWSTWRGETEYGIKALPLGGFVKIVGMTSMDEVDPEDEPRSFRRAPGWQRLIVLAAGSFMHFVLAAVLIFGLALAIGIENDNTTQLGTVATCVAPSEKALVNGAACTASDAPSPASIAGLRVGDQITSFNGVKVNTWTQVMNVIEKAKPGTTVALTVERDGRTVPLHATLASVKGRTGGYLGVAAATVFQRTSLAGAIGYVGTGFSEEISGSAHALAQLPSAVPNLFSKDRSQTAAGNVSSVVGAAEDTGQAVAANVGWEYKVSFVLLLVASLNIWVGILNLLPLLPMDGGHIAVVLWEMIRGRWARARHRANPGLVDYRKLVPVSFSIFMVLIFFSALLILADIVNPVNIG